MTDPISAVSSMAALASPADGGRAPSFAAPVAASQSAGGASGDLPAAVRAMTQHFDAQQSQVRFRIDQDMHRLVVSVVDAQSGAVLIQLPSEDALAIAHSIERTRAALVQQKA